MNNDISESPKVVLLECPKCRNELSGWLTDRLFFCSNCGIAVDYRLDPPAIIPVRYADWVESKPDCTVWLPVWRADIDVTIDSTNSEVKQRVQIFRPDKVWVFGMIIVRMNLYGNAHVDFSRLKPIWSENGVPRNVYGCQIRKTHAIQLAGSVVAALIDRDHDVTDLSITTLVRTIDLHAIPFEIHDTSLVNPNTGFSINRSSVAINRHLDGFPSGDSVG
ncbi:hypothetical protein JW823_03215 [bacterium]|nr:hypothetical protein [candidate division CSSED10-310 bacterium]